MRRWRPARSPPARSCRSPVWLLRSRRACGCKTKPHRQVRPPQAAEGSRAEPDYGVSEVSYRVSPCNDPRLRAPNAVTNSGPGGLVVQVTDPPSVTAKINDRPVLILGPERRHSVRFLRYVARRKKDGRDESLSMRASFRCLFDIHEGSFAVAGVVGRLAGRWTRFLSLPCSDQAGDDLLWGATTISRTAGEGIGMRSSPAAPAYVDGTGRMSAT